MMKHSIDRLFLPQYETVVLQRGDILVADNLEMQFTFNQQDRPVDDDKRFPVKLPSATMIIVIDGVTRIGIHLKECVLTTGSCLVIHPDTIVEKSSMDYGSRAILLSFPPEHDSLGLLSQQAMTVKLAPKHLDLLIQAYRLLRQVMTDTAIDDANNVVPIKCLDLITAIIMQAAAVSVSSRKTSRRDEIVSCFMKSVAENYRQHRELSFYADQLSLSLKHLSLVIHEQTGRHPSQWIKDYVILDAKTMLRSGLYSVQQVAAELNFPNQSFFGKYFKEAVGVSPKKWK